MAEGEITIEELLAEVQPRTATALLLLRQDLLEEHARLDAELTAALQDDALQNRNPVAPALAEQITALEAQIEAAKRPFVVRQLGGRSWKDLLGKHPPTKEQLKVYREQGVALDFNPDTFPPVAIAESSVSPKMTVDQVKALEAKTPVAEFDRLWKACCDANLGGNDSPKSLGAGLTLRVNGASGPSPASVGLPDPSSSDE